MCARDEPASGQGFGFFAFSASGMVLAEAHARNLLVEFNWNVNTIAATDEFRREKWGCRNAEVHQEDLHETLACEA
ncbi:MAG: hypothetical protein K8H74_14890 [Notoacmeibacter sp.]|nr:hypothetical protein [Notoacmeibacter sp.]